MNPSGGGAGDLTITVGGDLTPLTTALAAVPEAFSGLTTEVQDAFAGLGATLDSVSEGITNLGVAASAAAGPVESLAEQLDLFAGAPLTAIPEAGAQLEMFATYAGDAAAATESLGAATASATPSISALGTAAETADGSTDSFIGRLGLALIAVRTLQVTVTDMVTAYGDLQKATLSLDAILGNTAQADAAINSAKQLADALGVAQDSAISAQQKLLALGEPLQAIPGEMTAIADGAAAMNTSFDTAAQRFDQIINSGSLMARSLTSIGLSTNDVAAAMGEAGVPANLLTTAFKGLDEQQRAAVISSAELAKNAGLAAAAASGVSGTWNDVKNAIEDAWQSMGKATNGFAGLATAAITAVNLIASAFSGLTGTIKIVTDAIIAVFMSITGPLSAIGKTIADAITGNFKALPGDLAEVVDQAQGAMLTGWHDIQQDAQQAGASVVKTWGATGAQIVSGTQSTAAQAGAALNVLQAAASNAGKNFAAVATAYAAGKITAAEYTAALNALNTAQENANHGFEQAGTAALIAANAYHTIYVNSVNAHTSLTAIAADVANGTATWGQYDAALKQLNTDQMAANNGFEDAHTALLVVQEDFQDLGVKVANAYTDLQAVVTAMASGSTGAVQYTAALNALNAAQKELNNGYEDAHTAFLLAQNDFRTLQVAATNAATVLAATKLAYDSNTAGLNQLIAALEGYAKAQTAASGGVEGYAAAVDSITASQKQLSLNLQNANTELAAASELYGQGAITAGVYQTYVSNASKAQEALKGTQDALTTSQRSGASAVGALGAAQASTNAIMQDAVTASTMSTTAYYQNVTAIAGISNAHEQLQLNLQNSTQYLEAVTAAVNNGTASGGQLAAALQKVSQAEQALTGSAAPAASALQGLDSSLVQTATDAQQAAAGLTGIGAAAKAAGQAVQSLGQELDQTMNASIGNAQFSLSPGQTYTQPSPGTYIGGTEALGQQDPTEIANQTYGFGETNTFDPAAIAAAAQQATSAITGLGTAATSASTATTTASDALVAALQAVSDANTLEQEAASKAGTAAYDGLKAVADQAAQTAAAALAAAEGLNQVATATTGTTTALQGTAPALSDFNVSTAGMSSAMLNASNDIVGAGGQILNDANDTTTAVGNLANVLNDSTEAAHNALQSLTTASETAAQALTAMTPVIGALVGVASQPEGLNLANAGTILYGPGQGVGGNANTSLLTDTGAPTIGSGTVYGDFGGAGNGLPTPQAQPSSLIVNVTNTGTVVGANGMQQFSTMVADQIARNLGSIGIRLNRQ